MLFHWDNLCGFNKSVQQEWVDHRRIPASGFEHLAPLALEWLRHCAFWLICHHREVLFLKMGWEEFDHSKRTSSFVVCCHGKTSLSGRKWQEGLKWWIFLPLCIKSGWSTSCSVAPSHCAHCVVDWAGDSQVSGPRWRRTATLEGVLLATWWVSAALRRSSLPLNHFIWLQCLVRLNYTSQHNLELCSWEMGTVCHNRNRRRSGLLQVRPLVLLSDWCGLTPVLDTDR